MAKIPAKVVIDVAKNYGPQVIKFVKEHKDIIVPVLPAIPNTVKKLKLTIDNRKLDNPKKEKTSNTNEHIRKKRFFEYKQFDFSKLNRSELLKSKHEIENFITQIKAEEESELAVKKPVHTKRIKNWNTLLIQVENQMAVLDYQEYLRIYNDPSYQSAYFKGFERHIDNYRVLIEKDSPEELFDFIHQQTKRDIETIKIDFS